MSVHVSVVLYVVHMYHCGCHWTDCIEIWYWRLYTNLSKTPDLVKIRWHYWELHWKT